MLEQGKDKSILIVEDSPTQIMQLQHLLEQNGLTVLIAHDGEEGLHTAQMHLPNMIVLDIELPGMDGLRLCKLLKENKYTRKIPIILLTHLTDTETAKYGFQAGAIKYIPKDENAEATLLETIRAAGLMEEEVSASF